MAEAIINTIWGPFPAKRAAARPKPVPLVTFHNNAPRQRYAKVVECDGHFITVEILTDETHAQDERSAHMLKIVAVHHKEALADQAARSITGEPEREWWPVRKMWE